MGESSLRADLELLGLPDLQEGRTEFISCPMPDHGQTGDSPPVAVKLKGDKVLAYCHGCKMSLDAMRPYLDSHTPMKVSHKKGGVEVARYIVRDANGVVLAQKTRIEGKSKKWFNWFHADGIVSGQPDESKGVLYGEDILAGLPDGRQVVLCNGEKAVDRAQQEGIVAVCTTAGEATPLEEREIAALSRFQVLAIIDRDASGDHRARHLRTVLPQVVFAQSATQGLKDDLFDHLEEGLDLEDLAPYDVVDAFEVTDLAELAIRGFPDYAPLIPGLPLIQGRSHAITSHPGVGKSFFAAGVTTKVLKQGGIVVWVDEEPQGPKVATQRFLDFGCTPDDLSRLRYMNSPSPSLRNAGEFIAQVKAYRPWLVIFDTQSDLLSASGLREKDADDVTIWFATFIKPLTDAEITSAILDHLTKDSDGHDFARGSSAKNAKVDVQLRLQGDTFNKQKIADMELYVTKDRLGTLHVKEDGAYSIRIGGKDGRAILDVSSRNKAAERRKAERKEMHAAFVDALMGLDATSEETAVNQTKVLAGVTGDTNRKREFLKDVIPAAIDLRPRIRHAKVGQKLIYWVEDEG